MSVAVRIFDEAPGIRREIVRELRLVSERTTLRELIRRRIEAEAAEIAAGRDDGRVLVTPSEREARLNGKPRRMRSVDAQQQLVAAIDAFQNNRIIIIVGERQVTDLDLPIAVAPETEVTFFRLMPLVGG